MNEAKRTIRCAIYTRKSSEEGLEQEFNSLDAQYEACSAYIVSQKSEGWKRTPVRYDDGGISGGTLERPALRRLLTDIEAGRVDLVVVYKIDRLTRSLMDFSKLVERFDKSNCSFVSVTQAFNTSTSMGRLTLNVLLSFAQFEREVTAERIRDKIAASKKKGMWMGGIPPIGYDVKDKHLVINPEEAERVRFIFQRYLELPSVHDLSLDLRARGMAGKRWTARNGRPGSGEEWSSGALLKLLKRKLYIGIVPHKGKDHAGRQEAIIERELFDRVQAKLADRAHSAGARRRPNSSGKLIGLIFDDAGNRMSPVRQKKGLKHIRYYVSQATIKRRHEQAGSLTRVRSDRVEALVDQQLADLRVRESGSELVRVEVSQKGLALHLRRQGDAEGDQPRVEFLACRLKVRGGVRRQVDVDGRPLPLKPDEAELERSIRLARALRWVDEIESGLRSSARDIAEAESVTAANVMRDLQLLWNHTQCA